MRGSLSVLAGAMALPPDKDLVWLFEELDADSSGHVSRAELEQAILQIFGSPLEPRIVDDMMREADTDGDGEISLEEFKKSENFRIRTRAPCCSLLSSVCFRISILAVMHTADKEKRRGMPPSSSAMGMWAHIRERGPSRLVKASEEMRKKRTKMRAQRFAKLERALGDIARTHPGDLPTPQFAPLPAGGGSPPKAQFQIKGSPRNSSPRPAKKRKKQVDPEKGDGTALVEEQDEQGCVAACLADISFGCIARLLNDFIDTYLPFTIALLVPASMLANAINKQIAAFTADKENPAPPAPPSAPDFNGWMHKTETDFYAYAQEEPLSYLTVDLGLGFALGALALFWKDINDYLEARRLRAGYQKLDEEEEKPVVSAAELKMQQSKAITVVEELEMRLRVNRGDKAIGAELKEQTAKRAELEKILANAGSEEKDEGPAPKKGGPMKKSNAAEIMSNTANGFVTVSVYFADVISDVQVLAMLYNTGNLLWAALSLFFLVAQFVAIYVRVLPYFYTNFGEESWIYRSYLWLGCPLGSLALDLLMFLEPFGLLTVLPLPMWLKTFIPAYKATRVIAEVFIESLPQCLLQSYILVVVMDRIHKGTPRASDLAMQDYMASLPQSITISTLATLKTWFEIVDGARAAGISIQAKAWQLWNVGGGLPLDALKKNAIVDWACTYRLDKVEISPLLNALESNSSLTRLDLGQSGIEWGREDASGAPLIAAMATNAGALAALERFIISELAQCVLPLDQLRMGGGAAMRALQAMQFFTLPGGPWHEEIHFIGDLLRRNRTVTVVKDIERKTGEQVFKFLEDVKNRIVTMPAWEQRVKQFIVEGHARRSHLRLLVSVEVLRGVGFGAKALHDGGITLAQLKEGNDGFTVLELKEELGVEVKTLVELGYTPKEMREGTVTAAELKPFGYSATVMKQGTFEAPELKSAGYTLSQMKEAGYTATEVKSADFTATQVRKVGYTAIQCRKAEYRPVDMRTAGYTALEMRDGGYGAGKVRAAGYDATEATTAFDLPTLKDAGYVARELREAGHAVNEMKGVGFTLSELHTGGYAVEALKAAGFSLAELKEVGTSLAAMKASGASVKELRAAGYTAGRLKAQDYSVLSLMEGGYTETDLEKAGFDARLIKEIIGGKQTVEALKTAGFSVKELRAGGFSAGEFKGSFSVKALRAVGYSEADLRTAGFDPRLVDAISDNYKSVKELKTAGFSSDELKMAGYDAKDLRDGGFSADVLKKSGFSTADLRQAGFAASILRDAGSSLKELKAAHFMVEELQPAGFSNKMLKDVGFTASEFKESGVLATELTRIEFTVEELKAGGFTAKDIKGGRMWDMSLVQRVREHFNAKELKNTGLTATELKAVDFSINDLEAAGFGAKELKAAGFNVVEMRSVNMSVGVLRAVGCSASDLKAGGFTIDDLRISGFSAKELTATGYTIAELRQSGFKLEKLKAEGFHVKELKGAFTPAELQAVGFVATELYKGGVTVVELRALGFNLEGLKADGLTASELRTGGFSAKELKHVKFTDAELKAGGFRPRQIEAVLRIFGSHDAVSLGLLTKELKSQGFSAVELRAAGYLAKEMKAARFDPQLLHSVGYTAEEMRQANYTLRDLIRDAGYSGKELRNSGFPAAQFVEAPCSVTELKAAGFSEMDCAAAGLESSVVSAVYRKKFTGPAELTAKLGFTCERLKNGGLLPSECHAAGFSFEEGVALGFKGKNADWMTIALGSPYDKWS